MSENSTPQPLTPFLKETSSLYQDIPAGWPSSQEEEGDEELSDSSLTQSSAVKTKTQPKASFHPKKKTNTQQYECSLGEESMSDATIAPSSTDKIKAQPKPSFHPMKKINTQQYECSLGEESMSDVTITPSSTDKIKAQPKASFHPKKKTNTQQYECSLGEESMSDVTITLSSLDRIKQQCESSFHPRKKTNTQQCEEKRASHLNLCGKTKKRVSNCTSHRTDSGTEAEDYSTLADFSMFASNDMEDASYQSHSDVGRRDMQSVVEEPMRLHITEDALACSPNSLAPEISIKNVSLSNRSIILSGNVSDISKKLRRSLQSSKSLSQSEQGPSVANESGLSEEASMKRSESRNVSSVAGFLTRYNEIEDSVGTLYDCIQCSNNGRKCSSPASSLNETNDGHISLHNELDGNAYFHVNYNSVKRRRTQRSSKNVSQTDSKPAVTNEAKLSKEASIKTSESRDESLHDGSDESPNSANFSSLNATLGPQHGPSRISIGTNMNEFFAKPLHPVNKRLERFSSTSLTKSNDSISLLSKCMQKRKKASPKNNKASCGRILRDRDDGFPKYAAPKLARPAYWVTNRLYSFLEEKLYSEHGIYSKRVAEKIIQFLQEKCKKLMKTSDTELEDEIISEIQDVMVKLRITNSDFMFHYFCQQFLADEISNKIVPSLLPYSESCSRPNYHFANLFTKFF